MLSRVRPIALESANAKLRDEVGVLVRVDEAEQRAVAEAGALAESGGKSYQFGDLSKSVVESVRGEVQRQVEADWSTDDISLLLKVCLFLGAGTAAPVAGVRRTAHLLTCASRRDDEEAADEL